MAGRPLGISSGSRKVPVASVPELQRRICFGQGGPGELSRVADWRSLFVEQVVPILHKPFNKWKEMPIDRLAFFRAYRIAAEIAAANPQLEAAPRKRIFFGRRKGRVRRRLKGKLEEELLAVAHPICSVVMHLSKSFPKIAYLTD